MVLTYNINGAQLTLDHLPAVGVGVEDAVRVHVGNGVPRDHLRPSCVSGEH